MTTIDVALVAFEGVPGSGLVGLEYLDRVIFVNSWTARTKEILCNYTMLNTVVMSGSKDGKEELEIQETLRGGKPINPLPSGSSP